MYIQYKYNDEASVCLFVVKLVDKIEITSIYIIWTLMTALLPIDRDVTPSSSCVRTRLANEVVVHPKESKCLRSAGCAVPTNRRSRMNTQGLQWSIIIVNLRSTHKGRQYSTWSCDRGRTFRWSISYYAPCGLVHRRNQDWPKGNFPWHCQTTTIIRIAVAI